MERIRVDFNRRGREGRLVTSIRRASGAIVEGDTVEVFQPGEDDMTSLATVSVIDAKGRVELTTLPKREFVFSYTHLWVMTEPQFSSSAAMPTDNYFVTPQPINA